MIKKIFSLFFVLLICLSASVPAFAEESGKRVIDTANVLTDAQESEIEKKLDEISGKQKVDIAVAAVRGTDGESMQTYSDDLYENQGLGQGSSRDGVLLVVDVTGRHWHISTCGYGITAFTDAGIQYIGKNIGLSEGDYADSFLKYASLCDDFISHARKGKPYDSGSMPKEPLSPKWIVIALLFGFGISGIAVFAMIMQMKTVAAQNSADSYIRKGSFHVTERRDLYLYRNVVRHRKQSNNSSGGSSTHTSSSGRTFGGGGGDF